VVNDADEPTLTKEERTRLYPNMPELSKVGYQGNPDPWRVTEWAKGYDVLGQKIEDPPEEIEGA